MDRDALADDTRRRVHLSDVAAVLSVISKDAERITNSHVLHGTGLGTFLARPDEVVLAVVILQDRALQRDMLGLLWERDMHERTNINRVVLVRRADLANFFERLEGIVGVAALQDVHPTVRIVRSVWQSAVYVPLVINSVQLRRPHIAQVWVIEGPHDDSLRVVEVVEGVGLVDRDVLGALRRDKVIRVVEIGDPWVCVVAVNDCWGKESAFTVPLDMVKRRTVRVCRGLPRGRGAREGGLSRGRNGKWKPKSNEGKHSEETSHPCVRRLSF